MYHTMFYKTVPTTRRVFKKRDKMNIGELSKAKENHKNFRFNSTKGIK